MTAHRPDRELVEAGNAVLAVHEAPLGRGPRAAGQITGLGVTTVTKR